MVVVVVIAILASVALPSYNDYVRRAQVVEASTFLSDYRVKMEQYYQDYRNYGADSTCVNGANAPAWTALADSRYFAYACVLTQDGQGYTLSATGRTGAAVGHAYTLDQDNVHTTTRFKGGDVSKSCWLITGSEC